MTLGSRVSPSEYSHVNPILLVQVRRNGYDEDGLYTIFIGKQLVETLAYCKQKVFDGGWQVIQQRMLQFPYTRPIMRDYVNGFGRPDGDFWIGLDSMATITAIPHELLIMIRDRFGRELFAHYAFVRINTAELGYAMQLGEQIDGELPDEWTRLGSAILCQIFKSNFCQISMSNFHVKFSSQISIKFPSQMSKSNFQVNFSSQIFKSNFQVKFSSQFFVKFANQIFVKFVSSN